MKNQMHVPGLLPPEKQNDIRFYLFKSLRYSTRMKLYYIFIAAGFIIQIIMMAALPGAVLLLMASLLNLVRGYNSKVELNSFHADSSWTPVDIEKLAEVEAFNSKLSKWDEDALDISNVKGFLVFLLALLGLIVVSAALPGVSSGSSARVIFVLDAIILVLPVWFNGLKKIHKQDLLCMKTGIVRTLEEFFRTIRIDGENFIPAFMLVRDRTGKSIPTDCRFMVSYDNMPGGFYGIQAQINMNTVEGTNYPYFYCVIAAEKGFGLAGYVNAVPIPNSIVVNYEEDGSAEVIVIRQHTTKTSGYHTKINSCKSILERSMQLARLIVQHSAV